MQTDPRASNLDSKLGSICLSPNIQPSETKSFPALLSYRSRAPSPHHTQAVLTVHSDPPPAPLQTFPNSLSAHIGTLSVKVLSLPQLKPSLCLACLLPPGQPTLLTQWTTFCPFHCLAPTFPEIHFLLL